jgi:hypothetical protein
MLIKAESISVSGSHPLSTVSFSPIPFSACSSCLHASAITQTARTRHPRDPKNRRATDCHHHLQVPAGLKAHLVLTGPSYWLGSRGKAGEEHRCPVAVACPLQRSPPDHQTTPPTVSVVALAAPRPQVFMRLPTMWLHSPVPHIDIFFLNCSPLPRWLSLLSCPRPSSPSPGT